MKCMDFSNDVTKWFECYLSKRMFSLHKENCFSDKALIICEYPKDPFYDHFYSYST